MPVSDDCLPVALFLSMSVRAMSRTLARREMSNSKTPRRFAKAILGAEPIKTDAPKNAERIRGRHAAITNNYNSWRSYKAWMEKIRGAWQEKK
jgi:hypothetical protein